MQYRSIHDSSALSFIAWSALDASFLPASRFCHDFICSSLIFSFAPGNKSSFAALLPTSARKAAIDWAVDACPAPSRVIWLPVTSPNVGPFLFHHVGHDCVRGWLSYHSTPREIQSLSIP